MPGATITQTRSGRAGARAVSRSGWWLWSRGSSTLRSFITRPQRERHGPFDDDLSVHARHTAKHTHAASQAPHDCFDHHLIAGVHRTPVPDPLDAHEVDQLLT